MVIVINIDKMYKHILNNKIQLIIRKLYSLECDINYQKDIPNFVISIRKKYTSKLVFRFCNKWK